MPNQFVWSLWDVHCWHSLHNWETAECMWGERERERERERNTDRLGKARGMQITLTARHLIFWRIKNATPPIKSLSPVHVSCTLTLSKDKNKQENPVWQAASIYCQPKLAVTISVRLIANCVFYKINRSLIDPWLWDQLQALCCALPLHKNEKHSASQCITILMAAMKSY